jgi:MinD-like ATPase involved in chromosome partitioning or flagellar assembly
LREQKGGTGKSTITVRDSSVLWATDKIPG